ncbi:hypothetical protein KFK09_017366 [Dendrobium nobile]|uniref:Uncharacterized protein n=1 Tax=Dendrobium nobile TaxID=94219 RepID=A0A8T3B204_DENNO|nr:hypothetical protein KFK09_017366 [Dendrobium nobile]
MDPVVNWATCYLSLFFVNQLLYFWLLSFWVFWCYTMCSCGNPVNITVFEIIRLCQMYICGGWACCGRIMALWVVAPSSSASNKSYQCLCLYLCLCRYFLPSTSGSFLVELFSYLSLVPS